MATSKLDISRAYADWLRMWWQSWFGRCALHLPWVLCAVGYLAFLGSAQGQTALEYPVELPLTAIFVVGTLIGLCTGATRLLVTHHPTARYTPPLLTLAGVCTKVRLTNKFMQSEAGESRRQPRWSPFARKAALSLAAISIVAFAAWPPTITICLVTAVAVIALWRPDTRWGLWLPLLVLSGMFLTGVLTVALTDLQARVTFLSLLVLVGIGASVYHSVQNQAVSTGVGTAVLGLLVGGLLSPSSRLATATLLCFSVSFALGLIIVQLGGADQQKRTATADSNGSARIFLAPAIPAAIAILIYAAGILLVTNDVDALVALGPHALVASGLLALTLLWTSLLYLVMRTATLRAGWLLLALGVAVYLAQSPLEERPNPLLATTPTVTQPDTSCARLARQEELPGQSTSRPTPQPAPDPKTAPSILISAEGGGIRAAYWTAVSLEDLSQSRTTRLTADTAVISGVSGGSLGVATFLAAQELPAAARLPCIREFLSGDFLSPLLAGLLFLDVPRLILPTWLIGTHRGDYFENDIARRWLTLTGRDYFYRPLTQAAGNDQRRPDVYFNATDAISGEFVTLTSRQTSEANASGKPRLSPLNVAILNRLPNLRIAQAVHMSARFPYLSPNPDLRIPATDLSLLLYGQSASVSAFGNDAKASLASLVDGGYFDNSGLWPALHVLENDRTQKAERKWFVIHIVNDRMRTCAPGKDKEKSEKDREKLEQNTGCIHAVSKLIEAERLSSRGGWLSRPPQAIEAVGAEHSLQSVEALKLVQSQLTTDPLEWKVPMEPWKKVPEIVKTILDFAESLPIHGRDLRPGGVALAWTLAPTERVFLCNEAAAIKRSAGPGIRSAAPSDKAEECQ